METPNKKVLTKVEEDSLIENLSIELKFNKEEVKRIVDIYKKYLKNEPHMDLPIFSEFLHNLFGFIDAFFKDRIFFTADIDKDKKLSLEEFIRAVAIMIHGTMEEKTRFCFTCYDLSENNELTRQDIMSLVLEAVSEPPTKDNNPDALRDLVDGIFLKMDADKDGVINFEEFKSTVFNDWVILEAFGQCLPDYQHRAAFLTLLQTEQVEE